MLALVDMIRNENKMYINMGRKEGRKEAREEGKIKLKQQCLEIAKNLLKLNMPISQISEVTKLPEEEIEKMIKEKFDLTPNGIIKYLELEKPIYSKTTNYGHFGKNGLKWEEIIEM